MEIWLLIFLFFVVMIFIFLFKQSFQKKAVFDDISKLFDELIPNLKLYAEANNNNQKVAARNDIIALRPWMQKYISINNWRLTYDESDEDFLDSLTLYVSRIQLAYDKIEFHSKQPLSLQQAVLDAFLFPSIVLKWFGINLNQVPARIFSLFIYVATYIFEKFGSDFFNFISNLFKQ